ncbi:uncharacterized protein LOC116424952 isoform X5 [Nomia melanderi]|uniref:uncharacterized protein LOC116424952 isoform X5 n=1 Tax=Nomia melanderi TaxID=2448451 RepID=UPI0013043587|nr:uncharacterized protein LOC116424952 isoform X4 [Nomia melanderi]
MAIMQSCCCWRSVRRGSFACAIYSGIYFAVLALTTGKVLQGESQYLKGNRSLPESTSFLEPDNISPTTVWINVALLLCSSCGVICSILLLYGLFKDERVFLIPWIAAVVATCIVDVTHSLYLFVAASTFDPVKVMLYTLNFFLLCLNAPAVRYATQPPTTTATSCLSSRRAATNNETKTTATPTQSPTAGQNAHSLEKSPVSGRPARKHVQFPDTASDDQKLKSESSATILIPKKDSETINLIPSSPVRLEDPLTIDQSQKNSLIRHT